TEKFSSRPLQDVSVLVDIKGTTAVKNVTCPTHRVEVVRKSENHVKVGYEDRNVTPDRDLLLYYALAKDEFALNFLTHRPDADADGYFMMLLSPNVTVDKVVPKNICFVVDKSGSMQGEKMKQARAALKFCVQSLRPGDRFNVVPFSTEADRLFDGLQPADEANTKKAVEFLANMSASGGTAIDEALGVALDMAPPADQPYMVVFLTDGLPTIGETREEMILANVAKKNRQNLRLFVFGVGNDVNTHLLDKLAENHRGSRDYVAEGEDLEFRISSFYTKVSSPVLSDLVLSFTGVKVRDVYPKRLPDLFKGSQMVVVGRYAGSGASAAQLTGKVAGETKTITHEMTFGAKVPGQSFLSRLWAIRKCGYLIDQIRLHGETKELKDEVVRLAKLHGIVTPYTSFLVLEDQPNRRLAARDRHGPPPPGTPAPAGSGGSSGGGRAGGWNKRGAPGDDAGGDMGGSGAPVEEEDEAFGSVEGKKREAAEEGLRRSTGDKAVGASKEAAKLKGARPGDADPGYVPDAGREQAKKALRLVDGTAFYKKGDVWIQAELPKDAKRRTVKLFSDEYFELAAKKGKVAKMLALGKVDFLLDGVVVQVR
ncbi:MAG: VWA domain-containing protein, partial [Planctomycetota bacterium]